MQTVIACLSASLFPSRRACVKEKKKYWHHSFQPTKYIPKVNKLSIYIDRYKIIHLLLMKTISQHAFLFFFFFFISCWNTKFLFLDISCWFFSLVFWSKVSSDIGTQLLFYSLLQYSCTRCTYKAYIHHNIYVGT